MAKKLIVLLAVLLFSCKKTEKGSVKYPPMPVMENKNITFNLLGLGAVGSTTLNLDWNGDGIKDTTVISSGGAFAKRTVNTRYIKAEWGANVDVFSKWRFKVIVFQDSKVIYEKDSIPRNNITVDLYP